MKLQTSTLSNHHLDMIKQLKELQYHILDQELNKWKRDQQLSGNGAPFANNLDQIQKWCEDLAEIIWLNRQQIRQLEMIQEGLNIPSQEMTMNILPEISDGLTLLLDSLVKRWVRRYAGQVTSGKCPHSTCACGYTLSYSIKLEFGQAVIALKNKSYCVH